MDSNNNLDPRSIDQDNARFELIDKIVNKANNKSNANEKDSYYRKQLPKVGKFSLEDCIEAALERNDDLNAEKQAQDDFQVLRTFETLDLDALTKGFEPEEIKEGKLVLYITENQLLQLLKQRAIVVPNKNTLSEISKKAFSLVDETVGSRLGRKTPIREVELVVNQDQGGDANRPANPLSRLSERDDRASEGSKSQHGNDVRRSSGAEEAGGSSSSRSDDIITKSLRSLHGSEHNAPSYSSSHQGKSEIQTNSKGYPGSSGSESVLYQESYEEKRSESRSSETVKTSTNKQVQPGSSSYSESVIYEDSFEHIRPESSLYGSNVYRRPGGQIDENGRPVSNIGAGDNVYGKTSSNLDGDNSIYGRPSSSSQNAADNIYGGSRVGDNGGGSKLSGVDQGRDVGSTHGQDVSGSGSGGSIAGSQLGGVNSVSGQSRSVSQTHGVDSSSVYGDNRSSQATGKAQSSQGNNSQTASGVHGGRSSSSAEQNNARASSSTESNGARVSSSSAGASHDSQAGSRTVSQAAGGSRGGSIYGSGDGSVRPGSQVSGNQQIIFDEHGRPLTTSRTESSAAKSGVYGSGDQGSAGSNAIEELLGRISAVDSAQGRISSRADNRSLGPDSQLHKAVTSIAEDLLTLNAMTSSQSSDRRNDQGRARSELGPDGKPIPKHGSSRSGSIYGTDSQSGGKVGSGLGLEDSSSGKGGSRAGSLLGPSVSGHDGLALGPDGRVVSSQSVNGSGSNRSGSIVGPDGRPISVYGIDGSGARAGSVLGPDGLPLSGRTGSVIGIDRQDNRTLSFYGPDGSGRTSSVLGPDGRPISVYGPDGSGKSRGASSLGPDAQGGRASSAAGRPGSAVVGPDGRATSVHGLDGSVSGRAGSSVGPDGRRQISQLDPSSSRPGSNVRPSSNVDNSLLGQSVDGSNNQPGSTFTTSNLHGRPGSRIVGDNVISKQDDLNRPSSARYYIDGYGQPRPFSSKSGVVDDFFSPQQQSNLDNLFKSTIDKLSPDEAGKGDSRKLSELTKKSTTSHQGNDRSRSANPQDKLKGFTQYDVPNSTYYRDNNLHASSLSNLNPSALSSRQDSNRVSKVTSPSDRKYDSLLTGMKRPIANIFQDNGYLGSLSDRERDIANAAVEELDRFVNRLESSLRDDKIDWPLVKNQYNTPNEQDKARLMKNFVNSILDEYQPKFLSEPSGKSSSLANDKEKLKAIDDIVDHVLNSRRRSVEPARTLRILDNFINRVLQPNSAPAISSSSASASSPLSGAGNSAGNGSVSGTSGSRVEPESAGSVYGSGSGKNAGSGSVTITGPGSVSGVNSKLGVSTSSGSGVAGAGSVSYGSGSSSYSESDRDIQNIPDRKAIDLIKDLVRDLKDFLDGGRRSSLPLNASEHRTGHKIIIKTTRRLPAKVISSNTAYVANCNPNNQNQKQPLLKRKLHTLIWITSMINQQLEFTV